MKNLFVYQQESVEAQATILAPQAKDAENEGHIRERLGRFGLGKLFDRGGVFYNAHTFRTKLKCSFFLQSKPVVSSAFLNQRGKIRILLACFSYGFRAHISFFFLWIVTHLAV